MKWILASKRKPKEDICILLYYPDDIVVTGCYWGGGQWAADGGGYDPDIDKPLFWAKIERPIFD